jgi:drug/metabolite transporter (DMT)-like permease
MVRRLWRSGALLLVLAMLFWSGNFVLGRAVHELITPIALSFWRWTLALAILLPYAWGHVRKDMPALRAAWKPLLVLAFLGISVFNTLVYLGLRSTAVVNGVLLQSAMPLVILLFSFALFRERVRVLQVVAIGVSLLGVGVIVSQGSLAALLQFSVNPGDAWIFTAVCCYALYSVLLRKRPQVHPLSFLAATFAIGAAILLPFYVWEEIAHDPFQLTRTTGAAIVYVALFPSLAPTVPARSCISCRSSVLLLPPFSWTSGLRRTTSAERRSSQPASSSRRSPRSVRPQPAWKFDAPKREQRTHRGPYLGGFVASYRTPNHAGALPRADPRPRSAARRRPSFCSHDDAHLLPTILPLAPPQP